MLNLPITVLLLVFASTPSADGPALPRDIDQIRAPIPPHLSCDQARELKEEVRIPLSGTPRILVTVHGNDSCWSDSLAVWQHVKDDRYRPFAVFDEGAVTVDVFSYRGQRFLHLRQVQPSARYTWVGDIVLHAPDDGKLQVVPFSGQCVRPLPELGAEFHNTHGAGFRFEDDELRFWSHVWKPGDPEYAPSGGRVHGTLSVVPAEPGWKLVVASCVHEEEGGD